ncbi:hypothetical protein K402DRAFT_238607 [Aulographum hederae CBS 113979]|uniref:Uncharacterized protein n=1 Tax=Aulographum hederae CBS 113979 TaxID=1176131 RepID=A0A6G1GKS8_9PEZI|nr:hypothetical protein K402DRAFT_238607 [Aulographum hederae CBS 113979]
MRCRRRMYLGLLAPGLSSLSLLLLLLPPTLQSTLSRRTDEQEAKTAESRVRHGHGGRKAKGAGGRPNGGCHDSSASTLHTSVQLFREQLDALISTNHGDAACTVSTQHSAAALSTAAPLLTSSCHGPQAHRAD